MSDIENTSKQTSENSESPTPEPEPTQLEPAPESPEGDPGDITCLAPPPRAPVRHLPHLDPDPLLAAQCKELAHRPDLCDPVLRHHMRLPPLPDPYEEQRRRAEAWKKVRHKYVK